MGIKRWVLSIMVVMVMSLGLLAACAPTPTPKPTPKPTPAPSPAPTPKEDAAAFYKDKTVNFIVVGYPGGGMDTAARLFAPYFEKYTSTKVVVRNMPKGNVEGLNYLYNKAPRDGLTIAIALGFIPIVGQLVGLPEVQYDLSECNTLYGINYDTMVFVVSADSPYKSLQDMVDSGQTIRHAVTTRSASSRIYALSLLTDMGIKIEDTIGFKDTGHCALAVIRGEQDSTFATPRAAYPYIEDGRRREDDFYQ